MSHTFEKLDHLIKTLKSYIYRDAIPLETWRIADKLANDVALPADDDPIWRELPADAWWGGNTSWAWLVTEVDIPDRLAGKAIALHMEFSQIATDHNGSIFTDPEALVKVQGLNTPQQAINYMHDEVMLTEDATAGSIRVTAHCFTGVSQPCDLRIRLKVAEIVAIDRDVEAFYWDARVLLDAIGVLPDGSPERVAYLRELNQTFQRINWLNPPDDLFVASVRQAHVHLRSRVYSQSNADNAVIKRPVIHALGHAHIDVAWLWQLHVTRGKAVRTFSTAVALMAQFPDYTFTQSTPYLYKTVAEDDPELFSQIKARIATGQWNATGATWVEMDTNIPSGESLMRQFLFGMRYFERELGVRPKVLWLPDVFGYSAALPQIMRHADIPYFFTAKLSWNDHERMPYNTFQWKGLDGSRVLTHLSTTPEITWDVGKVRDYSNYVAVMQPEDVLGTWTRYKQKDANHHLTMAYGLGDGGGGPNRDMIERRARMENLSGMPKVIHSTAEQFFQALENNLTAELPRWVGELYFQYHRGTYTSQARLKRLNRKCEILLHDAEALASILQLLAGSYPQAVLNDAWETLLLNQFHDILPGTSIHAVHQDAERDLRQVQNTVTALINQLLHGLTRHIAHDQKVGSFAIFNTMGMTSSATVEVTLAQNGAIEIVDPDGKIALFQWLDRDNRRALVLADSVPAYGYKVLLFRPISKAIMPSETQTVSATPIRLENAHLRAEFDSRGNLTRLYDIESARDVLEEGTIGNQLWAYVDRPHEFDAWDIGAYVHEQGWQLMPESSRLVEDGPVRATLEVIYRFNKSRIVQRISLVAGQRVLTFETDVDWHEHHILLKTQFPLAVRAMNATYEVQFGTVERPTHRNTRWDQAQFEVPAQQWADMSESGFGVSLLNDCKYGYSAEDNVLRLSLLRSSTFPDPEADQGVHHFTYAIYPHTDDWRNGTVLQAKLLNHPMWEHHVNSTGGELPTEFGLVTCDTSGVVIDTVKKAEDSDSLIVRVYEAHGGRTTTTLVFAFHVESADEVNLLEESIGAADIAGNVLNLELIPYQIRSFKIQPDRSAYYVGPQYQALQ
ncbi:MAG: glycoside hydrolase family 38 C-terminal domain-containing protein [Aggregatilineales bacterium]